MKGNIVQKLTSKDDKYACAFTDRIVAESRDTDEWYFENWGVKYWSKTPEFLQYVEEHS